MKWVKTYKKTILFSIFLLIVSLIKIPSPDDLLNMLWVDVVPIHPTIENSIVSISTTPNVDKYEHCFLYAILAFIIWLEVPKKKKWKAYLFIFLGSLFDKSKRDKRNNFPSRFWHRVNQCIFVRVALRV